MPIICLLHSQKMYRTVVILTATEIMLHYDEWWFFNKYEIEFIDSHLINWNALFEI